MAVGSLKMSIRVSQEERLNGGGRWACPAAERAVGPEIQTPTYPGVSGGGGWNHLGAIGREETIHGQTGAAVRCTKSE